MRTCAGPRLLAVAAIVAVAALSSEAWIAGRARIRAALADPAGAALMTGSDSAHYLAIARAFAAGDLSFSYVAPTGGADLAHRQPLYPALLAISMKLGGGSLETLASLNLALLIVALWVAYAIGARVLASPPAGVTAAVALWRIPYLFENATTRLLTEPGYVLLVLFAAWGFLAYRARPRHVTLLLTTAALGLSYLQRINGIVLAFSALAALFMLDVRRGRRMSASVRERKTLAAWWSSAVLALLVLTAPSWLPRTIYAGQPLYHGYLANYIWVDEHDRAHVPGAPRYGWRDYAREHDAGAVVSRIRYGLRRTLWEAPRVKYGDAVASAMLVGALLALLARDRDVLAWLAVGLVQMLPLAWTALSNPIRRIPATALLPFGLVAIAAGVSVVLSLSCARMSPPNVRRRRFR